MRLLGCVFIAVLSGSAMAFGGEDLLLGRPWWHEAISREAARRAGFSYADPNRTFETAPLSAADSVAWHADYLDSYLYSPIWWGKGVYQGNWKRFKASMVGHDTLVRLHFDDLVTTSQVEGAYQRYLDGALAGLMYAAEKNDPYLAQQILGCGLHAIQDFYSHSNWIDSVSRRGIIGRQEPQAAWRARHATPNADLPDMLLAQIRPPQRPPQLPNQRDPKLPVGKKADGETWFEMSVAERSKLTLYTGTYEHDESHGVHHHGKYSLSASIMNQPGVRQVLQVACLPISPMSNSGMCQTYRAHMRNSEPVQVNIGTLKPSNVVYLGPPGIALDTTWLAPIGVRERGLKDLDPNQAFYCAVHLAEQASYEYLMILENAMKRNNLESFWKRVKTQRSVFTTRTQQWENYSKLGYLFYGGGDYPAPKNDKEEWFLIATVETANKRLAGTDADIFATVSYPGGSKRQLLDYNPVDDRFNPQGPQRNNILLAFNDHEKGDKTNYLLGPFPQKPSRITLENDALKPGEALREIFAAIGEGIKNFFKGLRTKLLSIIGGNADHVVDGKRIFEPDELKGLRGPKDFTVELDGGKEGHYRVHGTITPVGGREDAGRRYSVDLKRLQCIDESNWDRGSNSDEPFVIAMVSAMPDGTTGMVARQAKRTQVYNDVDDGESREMTLSWSYVVPDNGMITVPMTLFESDSERSSDRDKLMREFEQGYDESTRSASARLTAAIGAAIANDWEVGALSCVTFSRNRLIWSGESLKRKTLNKVLGPKDTHSERLFSGIKVSAVQHKDLLTVPD